MSDGIRIRDLQDANTIESGEEFKWNLLLDSVLDLIKTKDTILQNGKTYQILKKVTDVTIDEDKTYYYYNKRSGKYKSTEGKAIIGYCKIYNPVEITTDNFIYDGEIIGDGSTSVPSGTDVIYCEKVEAKRVEYKYIYNPLTMKEVSRGGLSLTDFTKNNQLSLFSGEDNLNYQEFQIKNTQKYKTLFSTDITIDLEDKNIPVFQIANTMDSIVDFPKARTRWGMSITSWDYYPKGSETISDSGTIAEGDCIIYGIVKSASISYSMIEQYNVVFEDGTRTFTTRMALPWADKTEGKLTLHTSNYVYYDETFHLGRQDVFYFNNNVLQKVFSPKHIQVLEDKINKNIKCEFDSRAMEYYYGVMTDGMLTPNDDYYDVSKGCIASVYEDGVGISEKFSDVLQLPQYDIMGEPITQVDNYAFKNEVNVYDGFIKADRFGLTFDSTLEYYSVKDGESTPTKVDNPIEADFNKYFNIIDNSDFSGFTISPDYTPFGTGKIDLKKIIIPEGYLQVGGQSFYGFLAGSIGTKSKVFQIILPSTLTTILDDAFRSGREDSCKVIGTSVTVPLVEVNFPNGKNPDLELSNVDYDILIMNNGSGRDIKLRKTTTGERSLIRNQVNYSLVGKTGDVVENISNKDLYFISKVADTDEGVDIKAINFSQSVDSNSVNCDFYASKDKRLYDAIMRVFRSQNWGRAATTIKYKIKGETAYRSALTSIQKNFDKNGQSILRIPINGTTNEIECLNFSDIVIKVTPGEIIKNVEGLWYSENKAEDMIVGGTSVNLTDTRLRIELNNKDYINIHSTINFDEIEFVDNNNIGDVGLDFKMVIDLPEKAGSINVINSAGILFENPFTYEANTIYRLEISLIQGWFVGKVISAKVS